jgi:hypothetical protein
MTTRASESSSRELALMACAAVSWQESCPFVRSWVGWLCENMYIGRTISPSRPAYYIAKRNSSKQLMILRDSDCQYRCIRRPLDVQLSLRQQTKSYGKVVGRRRASASQSRFLEMMSRRLRGVLSETLSVNASYAPEFRKREDEIVQQEYRLISIARLRAYRVGKSMARRERSRRCDRTHQCCSPTVGAAFGGCQ